MISSRSLDRSLPDAGRGDSRYDRELFISSITRDGSAAAPEKEHGHRSPRAAGPVPIEPMYRSRIRRAAWTPRGHAAGDMLLVETAIVIGLAGCLIVSFRWARTARPSRSDMSSRASDQAVADHRPKVRRSSTIKRLMTIVLGVIGLITVPWYIYANQDSQRLRCVEYKLNGESKPFQWTITCALNGNS